MFPEALSSDSRPPEATIGLPPTWEDLYEALGLDVDADTQAKGIRQRLESASVSDAHWCGWSGHRFPRIVVDGPRGLAGMIERRAARKGVLLNVNGMCPHGAAPR